MCVCVCAGMHACVTCVCMCMHVYVCSKWILGKTIKQCNLVNILLRKIYILLQVNIHTVEKDIYIVTSKQSTQLDSIHPEKRAYSFQYLSG